MSSRVVTRFAPSPTGFMHVGGVRTALFAWLYARKHGGTFILRIEDTDKAREVAGSIDHIIESLSWLGISWDEGPDKGGPHAPYLQSERLSTYREYAKKLIDKGLAYPDPYTEEEVEKFRSDAEKAGKPFLYREYRPESTSAWDGTKPLRFKVPEVKRYVWEDLARGELSAGEEALDDFILIKSDGYPTYNFAHIVDDHLMGVTHIVRGEEFISSTPKFLSLYEALEIPRPHIATVPVILGKEGTKKLGKRDGAKDILEYREEGYLPEAMSNFLALLGWHPEGDEEIFSTDELTKLFDLTRVQKGGARFDEDKLLHINRAWMRRLPTKEYVERGALTSIASHSQNDLIVDILKERASTFAEAAHMLSEELSWLSIPPQVEVSLLRKQEPENAPETTKNALERALETLLTLEEYPEPEAVKNALMPYANEVGKGAVLWPLRYALSGKERSPDPFTIAAILGVSEATSRIRTALGIL